MKKMNDHLDHKTKNVLFYYYLYNLNNNIEIVKSNPSFNYCFKASSLNKAYRF